MGYIDGKVEKHEAPPSGSVVHDDASSSSCYATEDDEETQIHLGPKISIKEHLEKDKMNFRILLIVVPLEEPYLGLITNINKIECPNGPSVKFLVNAVHTMEELKLPGNHLIWISVKLQFWVVQGDPEAWLW
ncbi:unnamed protein product [Lactuca saligna]|uniref:Uncharacterized protein n=1 Tax=Lactuca saligna TaxID=75948 RepID=A0AA35YG20_LACSI|nr:unnamed protein product [Lactuca saligna]